MAAKSDLSLAIGKRIREIRLAKNLSQQDLSDLMGTYRTLVARTEAGRNMITLEYVIRYAQALNVPIFSILKVIDEMVQPGTNSTVADQEIDKRQLRDIIKLRDAIGQMCKECPSTVTDGWIDLCDNCSLRPWNPYNIEKNKAGG